MGKHWSEYWAQGYLTSFGTSFDLSYSGPLENVWYELFDNLNNGFSSLDLATGNGALPVLIDRYTKKRGKTGKITALDLAVINESAINHKYSFSNKTEFISNMRCEELVGLESDFDLITSQFGIEYSNIYASLRSAASKLKPNGKIGLVLHNQNSLIIKRNKRTFKLISSDLFEKCLESFVGLIECAFQVNSRLDLAMLKESTQAEYHRLKLNETLQKLATLDEQALSDSELPRYVQTFMQQGLFQSPNEKKTYINYVRKQIDTLIIRLSELVEAALSESDLVKLESFGNEIGLNKVSKKCIYNEDNAVLAWFIVFDKSGQS